jgi:methyl coenzyme M reductase subunit D
MPVHKRDPKLDEVIAFLPANGQSMTHRAWREAIIQGGRFDLLQSTQRARRSGDVIFEIGNPDDPVESLTVRRAAPAAPAAAPAAVPPAPRTPGA